MKQKLLAICLVLLLTFGLATSALAQGSYLFSVDKEDVHVFWNADGSSSIDYTMVFVNQPGAHPIDYVDMGMPNGNYDMSTVKADVDGVPVSVSQGDYQGSGSGFAVVLGGQTISAGGRGTVHVYVGKITGVLYPDSSDSNYASGVFAPTFFGSQYVVGNTALSMTFHMPPGVKPEEPRWHDAPSGFPSQPQTGVDNNGRITYTWQSSSANASTSYTFGASFPKSYIPADAIIQTSIFDLIFGAIASLISFVSGSLPCLCFAAFFIGIPAFNAFASQRRKLQYLSPKVSIEGHGIKRGLTAVEAAILMEQPLDKVMTMILFGVIKKEAAEVVKRDPLQLSFPKEKPAGLHQYETDFLIAFMEADVLKRRKLLQDMTVALVKSVAEKMRGFSRKETVDYYKSIMERAWQQVEAADTPEVKSQKLDDNLEWTMLDRDYDDRSRRTFHGPIFVPMWWGRYDPTYHPSSFGVSTAKAGPSMAPTGRASLPGADFAASVVTGTQTFSSKVIGDLNSFTSRVTGVTNPPPKPSVGSSSRGGGGGGGHSCACACAGCACACAGGGR